MKRQVGAKRNRKLSREGLGPPWKEWRWLSSRWSKFWHGTLGLACLCALFLGPLPRTLPVLCTVSTFSSFSFLLKCPLLTGAFLKPPIWRRSPLLSHNTVSFIALEGRDHVFLAHDHVSRTVQCLAQCRCFIRFVKWKLRWEGQFWTCMCFTSFLVRIYLVSMEYIRV